MHSKSFLCFAISLVCISFQICAQTPTDTLKTSSDTLQTAMKDSVYRVHPIALIGSVERFEDTAKTITVSHIPWIEYRNLGDLLWTQPGLYFRDMGSPGQNSQLTIGGVDNRAILFSVDGVAVNDPITGTYNFALFPVDAVERVEFTTGPRAFLFGMNAAAGTVNIVTKSFYTARPYSRIRYSQGVNSYAQTDALFSQNLFSRFNFMFGLSHNGFGTENMADNYRGRFPNANNDSWDFRTKLRYNISDSFNLLLSHYYHQTFTGLNGGVDILKTNPADVFNEIAATVMDYGANEKYSNTDLALTAAYLPGGDSLQVSTLTVYSLHHLRAFRIDADRPYSSGISLQSDYETSTTGVVARHQWQTPFQQLSLSIQYDNIHVLSAPQVGSKREDKFGADIKDEVRFFSPLTVALFGRTDYYRNQFLVGVGSDATLLLTESTSAFGGISSAIRTPTLQELYWTSDSLRRPTPRPGIKDERHTLLEVGLRFKTDGVLLKIAYQHRIVANPIFVDTIQPGGTSLLQFTQGSTMTIDQVTVASTISYAHFYAEGQGTYLSKPRRTHGTSSWITSPDIYLDGSLYYKNLIVGDHLDIKVGVRGRYIGKQHGMAILNESGMYVPYTLASFGPSSTVDFFAIGKIGDAYIHLIWENLTNSQYMLTPIYPMYSRNVRFGVSWEFLD